MVRNDSKGAIALFGRVADRYPNTAYATAALYYRAFLQYKDYHPNQKSSPAPLRAALTTIRRLERSYPDAPQRADAAALRTRICGVLAELGDAGCREEVVDAARKLPQPGLSLGVPARRPHSEKGAAPPAPEGIVLSIRSDSACGNDREIDNAIGTLSSLWKADSVQAANMTASVLGLKSPCYIRLRQQAVILLLQRPGTVGGMTMTMFDAARSDPDPGVRSVSTLWLLNQEWEPDVAKFLQTTFGRPFRVKGQKPQ